MQIYPGTRLLGRYPGGCQIKPDLGGCCKWSTSTSIQNSEFMGIARHGFRHNEQEAYASPACGYNEIGSPFITKR
jgi:hypothetical protein